MTAVGVLHTNELPQYHGLPGLDAVAQCIPGVVNYLVRYVGLLLQRSTVPDGPVLRTWVRAPLDYARNAVVSLNCRPFVLSQLKCGSHVELLEFVRGLECLQVKTRRIVPFLLDMKIFYALVKMSFGASYAPWHVDQFLLGHPLLYGVWHPYKYSVEITYKAFAPIIKFLEQGWDSKGGAVVPMKIKLRHMEKTIVGLFLATTANKARVDSTTQVRMGNLAELSDAQRLGLKCLLALKALLYSYCPALLALGVLVRESNWNGRSQNSSAVAKECIGMSTVWMMDIIPSEKWLSTEYLRTNTVALLFWSDWHTRALGCMFFEEYGEALLSRLLMRSREVGNAQSVQQTTDIFLTLPPTLPREKQCQGVLTQKSMDKYTKHVRLFIQNISHPWFPIAVLEEDKYVVKRLDEVPRMQFPGVLSRTRVTEQQFLSLVRHSLRCLIAKTKIPNGVEDFLNAYSQKRSNVDQRQRSAHYQSINTAPKPAAKPAAKPPVRGVPWSSPQPPPPPSQTPPQNPPPSSPCLLLYRWYMLSIMLTVAVRAVRCAVTRPWKCWMRKRRWDGVHRVGTDLTA